MPQKFEYGRARKGPTEGIGRSAPDRVTAAPEMKTAGGNVPAGDRSIGKQTTARPQQSAQMYSVGVGVGECTGVGAPGPTGSVLMPVLEGLAWMLVTIG